MISLYRNQVIGVNNPSLVAMIIDREGLFVDPDSILYSIISIDSDGVIETVKAEEDLNLETYFLSTGRYVCPWTVPADADIDLVYRFKLTITVDEVATSGWEEFEVLPYDLGLDGSHYCFLRDLRSEGIMTDTDDPNRMAMLINEASNLIRKVTGRAFHPQYKMIDVDHIVVSKVIFLDEPIIGIQQVIIPELYSTEIDDDGYEVYARHLSQNLMFPDDREHPHIRFDADVGGGAGGQGIQIIGTFGYTDHSNLCQGAIPYPIRKVCQKLVYRETPQITEIDDREELNKRVFLTSEKTHSQSYTLDAAAVSQGFTGDRDIDSVLSRYQRSFGIGSL